MHFDLGTTHINEYIFHQCCDLGQKSTHQYLVILEDCSIKPNYKNSSSPA